MILSGVSPDEYTLTSVLTACSHSNMPEQGMKIFLEMSNDYNIKAGIIHHNCMVDMLARSGRVQEAFNWIERNIKTPDIITWTTLFAGG